ncbi:MAG: diguanylate cyclase [Mycobacterium sp.]|nr:diguanylate cyclase [Mycobacterium sp.]
MDGESFDGALGAGVSGEDAPQSSRFDADQRFRRLVEDSPDAIVVHQDARIVFVNAAGLRSVRARSADQLLGHPITEFVHPSSVPELLTRKAAVERGNTNPPGAMVLLRFDGTLLDVEVATVRTLWDGQPAYLAAIRDLTALRRAEQHFQTVVNSLDHGVIVVGSDGRYRSVNPAAERILGITAADLVGTVHAELIAEVPIYDADSRCIGPERILAGLARHTGMPFSGEVFGVDRSDGRRLWLSSSGCLLTPDDPEHSPLLLSFADITEQQAARKLLTHLASHDSLTGLPNRAGVVVGVTAALESGDPGLAAILFIDLDRLKEVNDTFGHHIGDDVLRVAAQRLRGAVRSDDVVGRFGGDEFVALLLGQISSSDLDQLGDRIHAALAEPVVIDGKRLRIEASIGIVVLEDDDPRGAAEILRNADSAMYAAKAGGGGRTHYFGDQVGGRTLRS